MSRITCLSIAAALALALAVTACAATPVGSSVTGHATSAYGGSYPIGSTLVVSIVVSEGSGMRVVAEASRSVDPGWEVAGMNRTLDFTVPYDAARIEPSRIYSVEAKVIDPDGRVAAVSRLEPAITDGVPAREIALTLTSPNETAAPLPESTPTP